MSISIALDQIKDVVKGADTRTTALAVAAATAGWWGVVSTHTPFVCGFTRTAFTIHPIPP